MKRLLGPLTALIAWTAVLVQLLFAIQHGVADGESAVRATVDYFSYFTVTTNTLCALVLTVPALAPESGAGRWFARPLPAAVAAASIVVVGVAYHVLLSSMYDPTGVEYFTDLGLHYIVPPFFLAWWLLVAPKGGLEAGHLGWFAPYPVGYLAWLVARGAVVREYPYFFMDVNKYGVLVVMRNAAGLLAFYYLVAAGLLALTMRTRRAIA